MHGQQNITKNVRKSYCLLQHCTQEYAFTLKKEAVLQFRSLITFCKATQCVVLAGNIFIFTVSTTLYLMGSSVYLVFEVRKKVSFSEIQHKLNGEIAVRRFQFSGIKSFVLVSKSRSRSRILPPSSGYFNKNEKLGSIN